MDKIFKYSDYRKYIKDYYLFTRSKSPSFTYRVLSARAGINSSGYYPLIVQGKRDLTDSTTRKTITAMELSGAEAEYFYNLVYFNQSRTLKKKNEYFDKLIEIQNRKTVQMISESEYDIFSEWYHCVIRELVVCRKFDNNFRRLGLMLRPVITEKQARESVELLLKLGFLKIENGIYYQSTPVMSTGEDMKSHQIINYQVRMLQLAIEAFDRFGPYENLSNSSTTFRISKDTYELFKIKNREHRKELLKIAEADKSADQVYQLNINMFPLVLSKKTDKK